MTETTLPPWEQRVEKWASDRDFRGGSSPMSQIGKLCEEIGEFASAVAIGDREGVQDAIGDIAVVVRVIAHQLDIPWADIQSRSIWLTDTPTSYLLRAAAGLTESLARGGDLVNALSVCLHAAASAAERCGLDFATCLDHAWEQIKDRRGKMIGGVFVKETATA